MHLVIPDALLAFFTIESCALVIQHQGTSETITGLWCAPLHNTWHMFLHDGMLNPFVYLKNKPHMLQHITSAITCLECFHNIDRFLASVARDSPRGLLLQADMFIPFVCLSRTIKTYYKTQVNYIPCLERASRMEGVHAFLTIEWFVLVLQDQCRHEVKARLWYAPLHLTWKLLLG